jgi:hypothetical protein
MSLRHRLCVLFCIVLATGRFVERCNATASQWLRPKPDADAQPLWGIQGGIAVALSPTPGPRGLIRIYTPYLDQPPGRVVQFIAIEPVVAGRRDLSELQKSQSDGKPGKRMWTSNTIDLDHLPFASPIPATGTLATEAGVESLSFYVIVEPFDNGAQPVVKVTLHSDRPHEIELQTFAAKNSKPMDSCVLTATMGNYARLRTLDLKDTSVYSTQLFKTETRDRWQFFPWHEWPASQLREDHGRVTVSASGEIESHTPAGVPSSWQYIGRSARQYWSAAVVPGLVARVNGRSTFWGTNSSIPGGTAYENFELKSPFANGQLFCFGVEPLKENR